MVEEAVGGGCQFRPVKLDGSSTGGGGRGGSAVEYIIQYSDILNKISLQKGKEEDIDGCLITAPTFD